MIHRGRRGERGETLIEILATIIIMGSAIIAIVAGIAVAVNSSDEHKKYVTVDTVLRDYAEAVAASNYNTASCAVPNNISYTAPSGYQVSAIVISCYDGTSGDPSSGSPAQFTAGGNPAGGAVRLMLEAHSTDNRSSRKIEMVKAKDYERPS